MSTVFLSGPDRNVTQSYRNSSGVLRQTYVSCTPAVDSVSSEDYVVDGSPATPLVFGTNPADCQIDIDMRSGGNALLNPWFIDGLSGNILSSWIDAATPPATVTWLPLGGGVFAARLIAENPDLATIYQDIAVPAGQSRGAGFLTDIDPGGGDPGRAKLYIQNLNTGNYLNSSSAWVGSRTPAATVTATGYTDVRIDYVVESEAVCGTPQAILRWELVNDLSVTSSQLDFLYSFDLPAIDFASVHGHNLEPGYVVPTLEYSFNAHGLNGAASWTSVGSVTIGNPSFYKTFTAVPAPWWRWRFVGTNKTAPYIGELVLGQSTPLPQGPAWGPETTTVYPGTRNQSIAGSPHVYLFCKDRIRVLSLDFPAITDATAAAILDLWDKSKQGLYPVIFVLDDSLPDVIFGRIMDAQNVRRIFTNVRATGLVLLEDPFPVIGP